MVAVAFPRKGTGRLISVLMALKVFYFCDQSRAGQNNSRLRVPACAPALVSLWGVPVICLPLRPCPYPACGSNNIGRVEWGLVLPLRNHKGRFPATRGHAGQPMMWTCFTPTRITQ